MSLLNEILPPFALPDGFKDYDIEPAVVFVGIDPREHALDCLADFADILCGDIVLVPFADGEPDWANTTRDTVEKFAGHWTEIKHNDIPRLSPRPVPPRTARPRNWPDRSSAGAPARCSRQCER